MAIVTIAGKGKFREVQNQCNFPSHLLDLFPLNVKNIFTKIPGDILGKVEEVRFRLERPIIIATNQQHLSLTDRGEMTLFLKNGYRFTKEDMEKTLHRISQSSIYAWEEEFKRGYITISGGHRVGLSGKVVLDKGLIKTMKDISGLNIRIAREIIGAADKIMAHLLTEEKRVVHTLLVSPPQCGKTTLLRDIVRQLSDGIPSLNFQGVNVGLVDERSEIAGVYEGIPQFQVGIRTDILDGCPKAQGMVMMLRSMSPQVIATDEIGTYDDICAIEEVINGGIALLTTVHGKNLSDIKQRPNLKKLLEQKLFKKIIILSRSKGVGTVEQIIDSSCI